MPSTVSIAEGNADSVNFLAIYFSNFAIARRAKNPPLMRCKKSIAFANCLMGVGRGTVFTNDDVIQIEFQILLSLCYLKRNPSVM